MLAFAIMADVGGDGVRGWLAARLAAHGLALDDDGGLRGEGGAVQARWSIGGGELTARPWHAARSPCPFVGPFAGYLCVEAEGGVPRAVARGLARVGRGVVARLDDDRAASTVALRAVDVEAATAPGGLDGGELLLERDADSAYAADVLDRIAAAAAARGLRTGLRWRRDAANPVELWRVQPFGSDQLYPPVWGAGGVAIDPLHALRGLTVELWLHDLSALDAPGLFA